jgi:ADP-ribose pyrophosphatase YjhB (NUDIX family)
MKFCSECAHPISVRIPKGDSLPRFVCDRCGAIHYENPKLVIGAIPVWQDRVLLCRRAIEPRYGLWTLPAGFMENGESTAAGAVRETLEEACATIHPGPLFSLIDVPKISQVHLFYRSELGSDHHAPGVESLETALFSEADIPWDDIAFASVSLTLRAFFADRQRGEFGMHTAALDPFSSRPSVNDSLIKRELDR